MISSNTVVQVRGRLVDARNGMVLWDGIGRAENGGGSGAGGIEGLLVQAVVNQLLSKAFDQAHSVALLAASQLVGAPQTGLLRGPRHPDVFGVKPR